MKYSKRGTLLLVCLLAGAVSLSAEPIQDLFVKIHTEYLAIAVPVSVILGAATALWAWGSENRRMSIIMWGFAAIFIFNAAGILIGAWVPAAT